MSTLKTKNMGRHYDRKQYNASIPSPMGCYVIYNGRVTNILKNHCTSTFKIMQSKKTLLGPKDTSKFQQPFINLHGIIPEKTAL